MINILNNKQDHTLSENKYSIKIYKRIRHDSITDYELIGLSNGINSESYVNTIELTLSDGSTIGLIANTVKSTIKSIIKTATFQIHIYFDEENNQICDRPSPYRLSNGLLLWCDPPKKTGQPDLSYIGFLSRSAKGWSGSIPHEVKLCHLNKTNNILNLVAIIGFDS